jgi:ElaB/YqjD/DUF883 family membrane-anchored ribosome-binding protein
MTDGQNSGFDSPATSTSSNNPGVAGQQMELGAKTGEAVSKLAQAVQQAGSQAKETASALAAEAGEKAKGLMHSQVEAGADFIGDIAQSVRVAADSLERNAPQLASLVRGVAQQVEDFSQTVRGQTIEEIFETTSDFVGRNPAMVFSAAAVCGFMLFRVIRAAPSDGLQSGRQQGNFSPNTGMQQASGNLPGQSGVGQSPAGSYHGT